MRAEKFERFRRTLHSAYLKGKVPHDIDYDHEAPWTAVFRYAARNSEYWQENVVRPAQNFLARGGAGKKQTEHQAELQALGEVPLQTHQAAASSAQKGPGEGTSKHARKRRKMAAEKEAAKGGGKTPQQQHPPQQSHPRKDGQGRFVTDRNGTSICFAFHAGSCSEPCPNMRAHVCQACLQPHRNGSSQCQKGKGKGGGSKGGGKGKKGA